MNTKERGDLKKRKKEKKSKMINDEIEIQIRINIGEREKNNEVSFFWDNFNFFDFSCFLKDV